MLFERGPRKGVQVVYNFMKITIEPLPFIVIVHRGIWIKATPQGGKSLWTLNISITVESAYKYMDKKKSCRYIEMINKNTKIKRKL